MRDINLNFTGKDYYIEMINDKYSSLSEVNSQTVVNSKYDGDVLPVFDKEKAFVVYSKPLDKLIGVIYIQNAIYEKCISNEEDLKKQKLINDKFNELGTVKLKTETLQLFPKEIEHYDVKGNSFFSNSYYWSSMQLSNDDNEVFRFSICSKLKNVNACKKILKNFIYNVDIENYPY